MISNAFRDKVTSRLEIVLISSSSEHLSFIKGSPPLIKGYILYRFKRDKIQLVCIEGQIYKLCHALQYIYQDLTRKYTMMVKSMCNDRDLKLLHSV